MTGEERRVSEGIHEGVGMGESNGEGVGHIARERMTRT